ncbi:MAG: triose-phosphate isomerase [Patescibacteria group bacterium]
MKSLIVGNWKLYVRNLAEGKKLLRALDRSLPRGGNAEVVVCPPVVLAVALRAGYGGRRIRFGTQDASFHVDGAHTGEVSPVALAESGIEYVILGHVEQRTEGDTDETVAKKTAAALAAGLTPVVCVGERVRDKDGHHFSQLQKNVKESLARITPAESSRVVVAYDPLWAIGNAEAPSPTVIREAVTYVRKTLAEMWGRDRALKTRIIYGGSVTSESAGAIAKDGGVQGLLPGRASIQPEEFSGIVKAFSRR